MQKQKCIQCYHQWLNADGILSSSQNQNQTNSDITTPNGSVT